MDNEFKNLSLSTVCQGAADLMFLEALREQIFPNIYDINTNPKKERSITIKIKFFPIQDRFGNITSAKIVVVDPVVKLAKRDDQEGTILLGKVDGEYQAKEIRQMELFDSQKEVEVENVTPIRRENSD